MGGLFVEGGVFVPECAENARALALTAIVPERSTSARIWCSAVDCAARLAVGNVSL